MSERHTAEAKVELSAENVAAYLDAHPDFFEGREALLGKMRIPHATGGAVSLVERQVQSLRERNGELEDHLRYLTQAARSNEILLERSKTGCGRTSARTFSPCACSVTGTGRKPSSPPFASWLPSTAR